MKSLVLILALFCCSSFCIASSALETIEGSIQGRGIDRHNVTVEVAVDGNGVLVELGQSKKMEKIGFDSRKVEIGDQIKVTGIYTKESSENSPQREMTAKSFEFEGKRFLVDPLLGDTSWANACGPCLSEDCPTGFLREHSTIGINPSGSSLCKADSKRLSQEEWEVAIKTGEIPIDSKFQSSSLKQVLSFSDLSSQFRRFRGELDSKAEVAVKRFLKDNTKSPVIFYSTKGNEMMVLVGSSDGKYVSFTTDMFKRNIE